ncbi:LysR family transcriptional regulator [Pseudomonas aeruginosa]|nr:LysR family transcriptional regulator [Pseudomonas aeruginosa]
MLRLDDMELFVEVVRQNSFKRAAEVLGVPISTLSRRLSSLERDLGVRLLRRTTRQLEVTEIGTAYFERCRPIVDEARLANQHINDIISEPAGILRVSMPADFSLTYILPLIIKYSKIYSGVSFELDVTPRPVDLIREPLDIAIRLGDQPSSSLIARHLVTVPRYLYASPAYVNSRAEVVLERPEDLYMHECLVMNTPQESKFWSLMSEG